MYFPMLKPRRISTGTTTLNIDDMQSTVKFIRELYDEPDEFIPLHAPVLDGNEGLYLKDCIDTTFVSSVGKYVDQFEKMTAQFTGAKYAVAVVNGTAALQIALQLAGVDRDDEVITQAVSFVATANAITHAGAEPIFIDVDKETMGMSPESLESWLVNNVRRESKKGSVQVVNTNTQRRVSAIVPMHTFGHPCRIDEIKKIADDYSIPVVEDSAESLGSYFKGQHTGTFGLAGIISYNGNKTITTGGGGMIITNDIEFARQAKHITTTAKVPHPWEYFHDEVGYNFRLTNVNAAIGVAQMEQLGEFLVNKRQTAGRYADFFADQKSTFIHEPKNAKSNFWLNAIALENREIRDQFLEYSNKKGVMTRPVWRLTNKLDMFRHCQHDELVSSQWLEDRVVNIPSGVRV